MLIALGTVQPAADDQVLQPIPPPPASVYRLPGMKPGPAPTCRPSVEADRILAPAERPELSVDGPWTHNRPVLALLRFDFSAPQEAEVVPPTSWSPPPCTP